MKNWRNKSLLYLVPAIMILIGIAIYECIISIRIEMIVELLLSCLADFLILFGLLLIVLLIINKNFSKATIGQVALLACLIAIGLFFRTLFLTFSF